VPEDLIEVVVVTCNSARHIGACIDSIVTERAFPIVVDNGSTDNTLDIVRSSCPNAKIIATGENLGYGKAMNLGFKETTGSCVVLSNPDVVFLKGSIRQMMAFLGSRPSIGIVGPQQMFPDRSWQRSYGNLPGIWSGIEDALGVTTLRNRFRKLLWPRRIDRKPREAPYVDGAVLVVRREAFSQLGGFDEAFFFYADESDLCVRLRKAGWSAWFCPQALVIHVRGADSAKKVTSDHFVRHHVASQHLLASRILPPSRLSFYAKLQAVHYLRLAWTYRILSRLVQPNEEISHKVRLLGQYSQIWREQAKRGAARAEGALDRERS
jgi:N-acetylglucosaminyl-diphospho-decaprenol L-rhamnosyltransferase